MINKGELTQRVAKKEYLRLILTSESLSAMPDCSLPFYIRAFLLSGSPPDKFMESIYLFCGLKTVPGKETYFHSGFQASIQGRIKLRSGYQSVF